MIESLDDARQELKRVDHLIFVSLKYTRTVDVILNVVKRMIDAYDFAIEALLRYAQDKKIITDEILPPSPIVRSELILSKFEDNIIKENMELYLLFRKVVKSNHERFNEYRRHVTLKTLVDNKEIELNIDNLTEYYNIIKEFTKYINDLIKGIE